MIKKTAKYSAYITSFFIVIALAVITGCSAFGYTAKGERLKRMQSSENYDKENEQFKNQISTQQMIGSFLDVSRKFVFAESDRRTPETVPDIIRLDENSFISEIDGGLRITWLGHSTIMVEMEDKNILIDPVFSERASPVSFAGPKRFHDVPIQIDQLPELDAVLISHDHYDHLDVNSIEQLIDKTKFFYVPLGVGAHLEGWGVPLEKIREMDWYEEFTKNGIRYVSTPARHFSGRSLFDRNATLWTSWVIKTDEHAVYYSGDTGPMPAFTEIGDKYGPFDVTMIQLGAYGDQWPFIHMTPEEAVKAHKQLRGKHMLPVHWGTFDLALHDWDDPIKRTIVAARKENIIALRPIPGEMLHIKAQSTDQPDFITSEAK